MRPALCSAFAPPEQPYLLAARQMQALSFMVHIPLVCFGIAFPVMVERAFRGRALIAGVAAGVLALVGLAVLAGDAPRILAGLSSGWGLAAAAVSAVGGVGSLVLVLLHRFGPARIAAGVV